MKDSMNDESNVIETLDVAILSKIHLSDVTLRGTDGVQVPSFRLVLAARSSVFERMLYGDFAESSADIVNLPFDGDVVESVSRYCLSGRTDGDIFSETTIVGECDMRKRARLVAAAHFLELHDLERRLVFERASRWMERCPHLSCALYDEAKCGIDGGHEKLASAALHFIHHNPKALVVAGDGDGDGDGGSRTGVCLLSPLAVGDVISADLRSTEVAKFQHLLTWLKDAERDDDDSGSPGGELAAERKDARTARLRTARWVVKANIKLHRILPSDLDTLVRPSGLASSDDVATAYKIQASYAEREGVNFARADHIHVRGAGKRCLNGNYYVDGTSDGVVRYSKKTQVDGRQGYVYLARHAVVDGTAIATWWRIGSGRNEAYYRAPADDGSDGAHAPESGWVLAELGVEPAPEVTAVRGCYDV